MLGEESTTSPRPPDARGCKTSPLSPALRPVLPPQRLLLRPEPLHRCVCGHRREPLSTPCSASSPCRRPPPPYLLILSPQNARVSGGVVLPRALAWDRRTRGCPPQALVKGRLVAKGMTGSGGTARGSRRLEPRVQSAGLRQSLPPTAESPQPRGSRPATPDHATLAYLRVAAAAGFRQAHRPSNAVPPSGAASPIGRGPPPSARRPIACGGREGAGPSADAGCWRHLWALPVAGSRELPSNAPYAGSLGWGAASHFWLRRPADPRRTTPRGLSGRTRFVFFGLGVSWAAPRDWQVPEWGDCRCLGALGPRDRSAAPGGQRGAAAGAGAVLWCLHCFQYEGSCPRVQVRLG